MLSVFVFCCVENECVISCTYKTQHKRLCTTRARDDTRNNVSQHTHRSGERKRGRRVLFLFAKEEEEHEEEEGRVLV